MSARRRLSAATHRRLAAVALSAGLAVGLSSCGLAGSVVGLHDAPVEVTGGAPINEQTAAAITARVLADAAVARAKTGAAGTDARKDLLAGSALTMAEAALASKQTVEAPDALATTPTPTVLAISRGEQWPRTILATTLDQTSSTQLLHVLVSRTPTSRFVLTASVPLLAGASVPALGPVARGVPVPADDKDLVAEPAAVLKEYAAGLAFPRAGAAPDVELTDALSTSLRSNAAAQAKGLGTLATLNQTQAPDPAVTLTFPLADGSALVFGQLVRTDAITLAKAAKELVLPAPVAALVGKAKVTKAVTVTSLESVVMVVPVQGKAKVIGADEQLASATAR